MSLVNSSSVYCAFVGVLQGAAKKPSTRKQKQAEMEERQEVHSETQRLIRGTCMIVSAFVLLLAGSCSVLVIKPGN